MRFPRPLAGNVVLALVAPAVVLGTLEGAARLLQLDTGFFLMPTPQNCLRRSRLLSMEFRPACEGSLHDTPVRTNADGLRGPALRPDAARRILAAGDSCTWGWRVRENESYPAVLRHLLDVRHPAGRFDVLNAGVPGYTSRQGLLYLRERGLAFHPAVVLLDYGFNDIFPSGDIERQLAHERRVMPLLLTDDFFMVHSRLYRWVRWKTAHHAAGDPPPRVPPEGYGDDLAAMVGAARAVDAKVLFLDLWHPNTKEAAYPETLAYVARTLDVPVVRYEGPRLDVVHPTADGYRVLAERVLERLEHEHWVGPP